MFYHATQRKYAEDRQQVRIYAKSLREAMDRSLELMGDIDDGDFGQIDISDDIWNTLATYVADRGTWEVFKK